MGPSQTDLMRSPPIIRRVCGRALMWCCCGILIALAASSAADCSQALAQEVRAAEPRPMIDWRGERLSVSAREVPWKEALTEIQRQTGVKIQMKGSLSGTLTHEFEALPLEQGLRRLFRRVNTVFFYAPVPHSGATAQPTLVWLLPRDDSSVPRPISSPVQAAAAGPYGGSDPQVRAAEKGPHQQEVIRVDGEEEEEEEEKEEKQETMLE